jgi:hypothetical protein
MDSEKMIALMSVALNNERYFMMLIKATLMNIVA